MKIACNNLTKCKNACATAKKHAAQAEQTGKTLSRSHRRGRAWPRRGWSCRSPHGPECPVRSVFALFPCTAPISRFPKYCAPFPKTAFKNNFLFIVTRFAGKRKFSGANPAGKKQHRTESGLPGAIFLKKIQHIIQIYIFSHMYLILRLRHII